MSTGKKFDAFNVFCIACFVCAEIFAHWLADKMKWNLWKFECGVSHWSAIFHEAWHICYMAAQWFVRTTRENQIIVFCAIFSLSENFQSILAINIMTFNRFNNNSERIISNFGNWCTLNTPKKSRVFYRISSYQLWWVHVMVLKHSC